MRNYLPALLASAITLTALTSPSYAQNATPDAAAPAAGPAATSAIAVADNTSDGNTESSQVAKTYAANLLAETAVLPIRLAAVTTALAIGTPIAVVRCEAKKQLEYGNAMVTEMNNNQFITPLMVASLPGHCLQTVGALATGVRASAVNAATAWDLPFTAKSLSLEDMETSK